MVSPITAIANKPSVDAKLGIGISPSLTGGLKITTLTEDGLFAGKGLRVGMAIDTINGQKCNSPKEAIDILKKAQGKVTIVASPTEKPSYPKDLPEGGVWGSNTYHGDKTNAAACMGCLCCGLPGLCMLMCPIDERNAYKKDGDVYLANGTKLKPGASFVPKCDVMARK